MSKEITCKCGCGKKKLVKNSDIKRGWGLFYNKSCKAKYQTKHKRDNECFVDMHSGYDGHGQE